MSAADVEIRMERLEAEMRDLTGKVEQLGNGLDQLKQRVEQINSDFDVRFSQMGGAAAAGGPPPRPPAAEPTRLAGRPGAVGRFDAARNRRPAAVGRGRRAQPDLQYAIATGDRPTAAVGGRASPAPAAGRIAGTARPTSSSTTPSAWSSRPIIPAPRRR